MNRQYLVRDINEIFGIHKEIVHAYVTILQYIYLTCKHKNNVDSIDQMIESFQILEYDTNIVENIYNLGIDLYLYDINKKIYVCDNISIRDYIAKINKLMTTNITNNVDTDIIDSKDLDIFIPMTEVTETLSLKTKTREKMELEAKLKMLQNIKKQETDKLEEIKKSNVNTENIINEKKELELFVEQMKNNNNIRLEEKKKKFLVDIDVFMKLEKEINTGKRKPNNIPELFVNEFKIFTLMKENNIFSQSDDDKFAYYCTHSINENNAGKFASMFTQPSLDELKKLEFSDTDSDYDDDYSMSGSDSESSTSSVDNDVENDIINMQQIIDNEM